jgi:hypothetical protein
MRLIMIMVMILAVPAFAIVHDPTITVCDLNRIPGCNSTTKYLEDYNMAIFKKGNHFVIWIEEESPDELRAELKKAAEACEAPGLKGLGNPTFVPGFVFCNKVKSVFLLE